jgi:N-acetyl sugar amidotransferase
MDTSDPRITFDELGRCDYCQNFYKNIAPNWHPDETSEKEIMAVADKIRQAGRGRSHDCIIGVSGGPDSSYAAYIAKRKLGLNPMLFHVDGGWNTQRAVSNIEKLANGLGLNLYTEVINWEEMKDLQVAFLRSQIPDQDSPQDIAFFSALYKFAAKNKIKYVLTGANISTECVREPEEWGGYIGIDKKLICDIHARFGTVPLKTFPIVDVFTYRIYYRYLLGMQIIKPLDYVPYVQKEAEEELSGLFGWQGFLHKHHESRFTTFFEGYWLPKKFGYDKRRAHFSSKILTNQMTRDEAIKRIATPEIDDDVHAKEFEYVANKLDLSVPELRQVFLGENRTYASYRNNKKLISLGTKAARILGIEKRFFR